MKPDRTRRLGFKVSLALHLILLGVVVAVSIFCTNRVEPKPVEPVTFVQIPVSVQPASMPDIPLPQPSAAEEQDSDPIPEPAKEPIQKQETKQIEPVKKPKVVEKQTNRVIKANASVEPGRLPEPPSEEHIRKMLTADIPMNNADVLGAGESDPVLEGYYSQVFSRMYAAWNQPSQLKTMPGLKTEVCIVVEPEGRLTERIKVKGSGNILMDDSVMKAVRSVQKLPPLPKGYRTPQEIIVTFVLGE